MKTQKKTYKYLAEIQRLENSAKEYEATIKNLGADNSAVQPLLNLDTKYPNNSKSTRANC